MYKIVNNLGFFINLICFCIVLLFFRLKFTTVNSHTYEVQKIYQIALYD